MTGTKLAIYLRGALEPIYVSEPMQATQMNMSAAMRNNMLFFSSHDLDGREVLLSIPNVLYMRDETEDD